jgi:hypothetical protein
MCYWVSSVVDRRRFRVAPQKGDIPYLPLNAAARRAANLWDPANDEAGGNACGDYGAVGVIERPGARPSVGITTPRCRSMRMPEPQTRSLDFGPAPKAKVSGKGTARCPGAALNEETEDFDSTPGAPFGIVATSNLPRKKGAEPMRGSRSVLVFFGRRGQDVDVRSDRGTGGAKFERDQREVEMLKAIHDCAAPGWAEDEKLTLNQALNSTVHVPAS